MAEFEAETESWEENILILMTDGIPTVGGDPCDEVGRLNAAGIETFVVGVSSGFKKDKVACLVPQDKIERHILTIPKFQAELFWQMEAKLRQVVCPIVSVDAMVILTKAIFGDYGYYNGEYQIFVPSMTVVVCVSIISGYCKRAKKNEYEPVLEMERV